MPCAQLDHAVQAQIRSMQLLILAQALACRAGWLMPEFMEQILSPAMYSCHVLTLASQYTLDAVQLLSCEYHILSLVCPAMCSCHVLTLASQYTLDAGQLLNCKHVCCRLCSKTWRSKGWRLMR